MRISSNDHWKAIIYYIREQDFKSFYAVTKGIPEFGQLINIPDEEGSTVLIHLAKNPNLISIEALQHLIKLAEEHKISKAELLNSVDRFGNTPLLTCVKSNSSLSARLMLIKELLDQGANPLLKVEGNLLNQFSVKDKEEIKANPVLKKAVLECNAKIQKLSYEMRIQEESPAEKHKKYKAFLTSSMQHRQLETAEVTSSMGSTFRTK